MFDFLGCFFPLYNFGLTLNAAQFAVLLVVPSPAVDRGADPESFISDELSSRGAIFT